MSVRAQKLRAASSPVERRMWRLLYQLRTDGYHFRKQAPIGPYVVDMACHHARLVIEVDGDTHGSDAAQRADALRDAFLVAEGYTVLRIANHDVLSNPEGVFDRVVRALEGRPRNRRVGRPLPNPPHEGEGAAPSVGPDRAPPLNGTSSLVGEGGRGAATVAAQRGGELG